MTDYSSSSSTISVDRNDSNSSISSIDLERALRLSTGDQHANPFRNSPSLRSRRSQPSCNIREIDTNLVVEILSCLEHPDVLRFGLTCKENLGLVSHARLWSVVNIKNATLMDINGLKKLISHSSAAMPLKSLSVCACTLSSCACGGCKCCSYAHDAPMCADNVSCGACTTLSPVLSKLAGLRNLIVKGIQCLTLCPFKSVVRSSRNLLKLDFANDVNVNFVIGAVAENCPQLEDLSFRYTHVLNFHETRQTHPLLLPSVTKALVRGCSKIKFLRFCHYTIDENCISHLMRLSQIEEADLSDNESLSGLFLETVSDHWKKLRKLQLRDCTELDHDHINHFATSLLDLCNNKFLNCPGLEYVDLSSQWSFYNDSLVDAGILRQLCSSRGSRFRWREDQCEVEGFGVDPEVGIDNIDHQEDIDFNNDAVMAEYGDSADDEESYALPNAFVVM